MGNAWSVTNVGPTLVTIFAGGKLKKKCLKVESSSQLLETIHSYLYRYVVANKEQTKKPKGKHAGGPF